MVALFRHNIHNICCKKTKRNWSREKGGVSLAIEEGIFLVDYRLNISI